MKAGIIDDTLEDIQVLKQYLEQYSKETNSLIEIRTFHSSIEFLECYQNDFDILFLDIEMPGMNGLEVARTIRRDRVDYRTKIVWITGTTVYTMDMFNVAPFDFLKKPFAEEKVNETMKNFVNCYSIQLPDVSFAYIEKKTKRRRHKSLQMRDIFYIEAVSKKIHLSTEEGDYYCEGTFADWIPRFTPHGFAQCHRSYLVNCAKVHNMERDIVYINYKPIPISRTYQKTFFQAINQRNGV